LIFQPTHLGSSVITRKYVNGLRALSEYAGI